MRTRLKEIALVVLLLLYYTANGTAQIKNEPESKLHQTSPWGVAAHPLWESEWQNLDRSFGFIQSGGMTWMREDFGFGRICKVKGQYDFSKMDIVVAKAEQYNVQIHPILQAYDNELQNAGRTDVLPMYNHPEEWRLYVRETVTHYKKKFKTWEIWNEPDGGFWKPAPNAEQYVKLLKIAYEEIKAIDSEALVVVGGLCYWNTDYMQAMYNAGAKGYFDAVAVHPYNNGPDVDATTARKTKEFFALMKKNGDENLPVWITEFGGATSESQLMQQEPSFMIRAIEYALSKIGNPKKVQDIKIGLAVSPRVDFVDELDATRKWLPGIQLELIPFDKLATLDPKDVPVLIGGEGIKIDEPLLQPLFDYVKRGGLMIGHDKMPFVNVNYQDENGIWHNEDRPQTYKDWGIHYNAWWTQTGVPESSSVVKTNEEAKAFGVPAVADVYADRFFTNQRTVAGDNYFPIIESYHNSKYIGDGMGLYTYKDAGGILMSNIRITEGYSEKEQANLLQRNFLTYLALGVEKLFWYDLHNDGFLKGESEHNFGLITWNWVPKPSYYAYIEMNGILGKSPIFKERKDVLDDDIWALLFERAEDSEKVLALWATKGQKTVKIDGKRIQLNGSNVLFIPVDDAGNMQVAEEVKNPIYIDFGNTLSPAPWNNMDKNAFRSGRITLNDEKQNRTSAILEVTKAFWKSDVTGMQEANNGWPSSVTSDVYVGEGKNNAYSELTISGLDPRQSFDFTFYGASAYMATDRFSSYKVMGANTKQKTQNVAQNKDLLLIEDIIPKSDGTIVIQISMGGEYSSGYYFFNGMIMHPHEIVAGGNVAIAKLWVDGKEHNISETFVLPRDYDGSAISLEIEVDDNATVHSFPNEVSVDKPGIVDVSFSVVAEDGETSSDYKLQIEKRFDFDELIVTRWNNTLAVINKKNSYGYEFIAYQWYKNGQAISNATKQYYSAGNNGQWLNENDNYYVEATEATTKYKLSCWESTPTLKTTSVSAYPNPVKQNQTLTVNIDISEEQLKGARITLYNSVGFAIKSQIAVMGENYITISSSSGIHVLALEGANEFKTNLKIIVQ